MRNRTRDFDAGRCLCALLCVFLCAALLVPLTGAACAADGAAGDQTAPVLRASVSGNVLTASATDDLSGVAAIWVNGTRYTQLQDGAIRLYVSAQVEKISVQAEDGAGNRSQLAYLTNPGYQAGSGETPAPPSTTAATTNETTSVAAEDAPKNTAAAGTTAKPSNTAPAVPTSASASTDPEAEPDTTPRIETSDTEGAESTALTPDGQGTVLDNVTDEDGKEFFTIASANENVFYLVIDKERDSENVYFLNTVTEDDLMALAESSEDGAEDNTGSVSAVPDPEPEPVCTCKDKCEPGAVDTSCPVCVLSYQDCEGVEQTPSEGGDGDTEGPEAKESGGIGSIVFIALAVLAVGGAGYYFKIYKPKHDLDDAEDIDELMGEPEETVNEDEDAAPPEAYMEPSYEADLEEPEEPEGYGD